MSDYIKHTWEDGEVIDAPKLNNIETGIAEAKKEAEQSGLAAKEAQANFNEHNTNPEAHADLRAELQALADRINAVLDSDDETLDELSEIVEYIKSNKELIEAITTSKVSVSDIVDNLVTNVANKPLSAAQGVALKALIDAVTTTANNAASAASTAQNTANSKAPAYSYGTEDLTAGSSALETGKLHFVYE